MSSRPAGTRLPASQPLRPTRLARQIRLALVGLTLAAGPALAQDAPASADTAQAQAAKRHYRIAAGPVDEALASFAGSAGISITMPPALVANRRSNGLEGSYGVAEGLARLLAGTGLEAVPGNSGAYLLRAAPASGETRTLAPVTVTSQADADGTTEHSESYTTASMRTATKLPLSLRETPQSVTVITRQRMDDQGMTSINDAVQATPGLFLSNAGGVARPSYNARGFDVDTVMYDGLPGSMLGYIPSAQANLAMYDRVEVVRGAAGLTQGAGNPSAALNLVRKRPTRDFQASVSATVGSWDEYGLSADVGGPLNESGTLRGRFVASNQDARSFRDAEQERHNNFYAVAEADLGAATTLTLGAFSQYDYTNFIWGGLPANSDGSHLDVSRSTFIGADWEYNKSRSNGAFGTLEHRFDNEWVLRLGASYTLTKVDVLASSVWVGQRFLWAQKMDQEESALDLYASGPFQLLGRRHELVAGISRRQLDYNTYDYYGDYLPGTVDPYTWNPRGLARPAYDASGSGAHDITTQKSVYLTARFSLADPLKLIVGAREDWYDYDNRRGTGDYRVTRNLTQYAGLIYDLDGQHSVYASYTDIFKPQTARGVDGKVLEPIVGENYELGIKGEYFDGALNASAALFQINQTNRARQLDDQSSCPTYPSTACSEASGLVRSEGVDLELQGALSPDWQIGAGYSYARARYLRDATASNEGRTFNTRVPVQQFKLTTLYRLPGELQRWRIGGNLHQQSRIRSDSSGWHSEQKAYAIVGLIAGYKASRQLDFQLNVDNLFDRKYYRSIAVGAYGPYDIFGDPRSLRLTARYTF